MPLDPEALLAERQSLEQSWTSADCLLYAVAVGADTDELSFVTENSLGVDQQVFPTFAVTLHLSPVLDIIDRVPGLEVAQLLHAGHALAKRGRLRDVLQDFVLQPDFPVSGRVHTARPVNLRASP